MKIGDLVMHVKDGPGYNAPSLVLKLGSSEIHHDGHILIYDEGYVYWYRAKDYKVISDPAITYSADPV